MPGMYLGQGSAFNGAFGNNPVLPSPAQSGKPPYSPGVLPGPAQSGTPPTGGMPSGVGGMVPGSPLTSATTNPSPIQGKYNPSTPIASTPPPQTPYQPWGANTLAPTAVRASGPSQGFDPAYLQNLATSIGGLFANNQGGNTMNINPLGNLGEISGPSGQMGNAPQQGLPQTWLQQALAGLGFGFTPQATTVTPTAPTVGSVGNGGGGAGGPRGGGIRAQLQ
jgi:hypothetical protein